MKAITCFILLASTALAQSVFPPARSTTPAAIATAKRCISAGGSSTAYTCTLTPGISSYTTSMEVNWFADVTSGASPTLDAGGGPVAIRDAQASAAVPSGWFEANRWYTLRHNGTYWLSDGCVDGATGRKCGSNLSVGATFSTSGMRINAKAAGALGDNASDDYPEIQSCITLGASSGVGCYLPPGNYRTSATLLIPTGGTLQGAGWDSIIMPLAGFTGNVIQNADQVGGNSSVRISDLQVHGNHLVATGGAAGIKLSGTVLSSVDRVLITNTVGYGMHVTGATTTDLRGLYILNISGDAALFLQNYTYASVESATLEATAGSSGCLWILGAQNVSVSNLYTEACSIPLNLQGTIGNLDLKNAYLSGNAGYGAYLHADITSSRFSGVSGALPFAYISGTIVDTSFAEMAIPTTGLTAAMMPVVSAPPGGTVPAVYTYTVTKVAADGTLVSGTYTSGITATGTVGQTCTLTSFDGGGSAATATVALTGTDTIAGGTALVVTAAGSGYSSNPTSATAGNGTATCSGTATLAGVITGPCQSAYGCFRVTGITPDLPATNAASLVIPFLAAPAKAVEVGAIQLKTTSACTGPATAVVSDIGTTNSATFFGTSLTHDLKTTAYSNLMPTSQGNDLATAQNWTLTVTTDGGAGGMNKDLAAGCAFTISVPWMVRP